MSDAYRAVTDGVPARPSYQAPQSPGRPVDVVPVPQEWYMDPPSLLPGTLLPPSLGSWLSFSVGWARLSVLVGRARLGMPGWVCWAGMAPGYAGHARHRGMPGMLDTGVCRTVLTTGVCRTVLTTGVCRLRRGDEGEAARRRAGGVDT